MKPQNTNPATLSAVVWLDDDSLLVAQITSRSLEGLPTVDIRKYAAREFRPPLDQTILTAPANFSFHTRLLNLADEAAGLSDVDLAAYLIESVGQTAALGDGKPLLENTLEKQVAQITRLPNEQVALTEMPRKDLEVVTGAARELFFPALLTEEKRATYAEKIPPGNIFAETPLRAALRTYLLENNTVPNNLVTVFVIATETGFATGLWNSQWGLFSESAEGLPAEFAFEDEMTVGFDDFEEFEAGGQSVADNSAYSEQPEITQGFYEAEPSKQEKPAIFESPSAAIRRNSLSGFLNHALDTAFRIAGETAYELGLSGIERVVFAVPNNCQTIAAPIAAEKSEMENTEVLLLPESVEEQVLRGLLFSQIPDNPLVEANLLWDLYVRLVDNSIAAEQAKRTRLARAQSAAVQAIALPFFLLIGFVLGSYLYYQFAATRLEMRNQAAMRETARLKPILTARSSYIENFRWRESSLKQTLSLKDRQTIAISFLPEVDNKYALASSDPKFSLDTIKLDNSGAWTMKGIASDEELVASFIRGLEYAENEGDTKKLFFNLTFEIRRGTTDKVPAGTTAFKSSLAAVPPGFIGWEIKGIYAPLAAITPSSVKPPPVPPAANPSPSNQPPPAQTTNK